MFSFDTPRRPRRPSLTPMIDVVFLLLVFFMIAARFGPEAGIEIVAAQAGGAGTWQGPPRLVEVRPSGLFLNGQAMAPEEIAAELARITPAAGDPVLLRARDGADLQALVDAMEALGQAGVTGLMLVE
ncbi:ExbD/TolR family protein [Rhodovulum sulfidophilum]|uniref:ExbD/TolR family protein n=1 Tax=Rhodovulum sulfidophilum TaxID=35806 RepID=UPI000951036B|nr:biopolymer transporter ExbD [Rhodovulum sulfidophilum]OLS51216.1 indolepyruvate ferredoxin oxidoreductase [Rhodovulum sulfidophilum]